MGSTIRKKIVDAQRGDRFTRAAPEFPQSSSSQINSASSEVSDFKPSVFSYETADEWKPGLKHQLRMAAEARRKLMANPNAEWAKSKKWGWGIEYRFDNQPYLKPMKKEDAKDGVWWPSTNDYLLAVAQQLNLPDNQYEMIFDAATQALEKLLINLDENTGITDDMTPVQMLERRERNKAAIAANPELFKRENEIRQAARNTYGKDDRLAKFELPDAMTTFAANMVAPSLNAVHADPELWYKTGTGEAIARGATDAAIAGVTAVAPELMVAKTGRSAFLGARPIINYATAGMTTAPVNEALNRVADAVASGATGHGTLERPFDPADLASNMAMGALLGGVAGKISPRARSSYDYNTKRDVVENYIQQKGGKGATLADIDKQLQLKEADVNSTIQDELNELERQVAELRAERQSTFEPRVKDETRRQMWTKGNRDRLEQEAASAGKEATANDFIDDAIMNDIGMTSDDFVRVPFRAYDTQYPTSSFRVKMMPEPGATHPMDNKWYPLVTTEGMPNIDIKGATLADVRGAAANKKGRGYHLGGEFNDRDLEPTVTVDTRRNLAGFKYSPDIMELPDGTKLKVPVQKNGYDAAYLGWAKPTPDFVDRYLAELGINTDDYPMEFKNELYTAIKRYQAGDPAAREWFGEGERILNELEKRKAVQAYKGKTLQSSTPGMASDNPMKNMAIANWIEHEGELGFIDDAGNFVKATPEQVAAREKAAREYSVRKSLWKPDKQDVKDIESKMQRQIDTEVASGEGELRKGADKSIKEKRNALESEKKEQDRMKANADDLRKQRLRMSGVVRPYLKSAVLLGNAVSQGGPASQMPPFNAIFDEVPNKTLGGRSDYTDDMVNQWKAGYGIPVRASDENWRAYNNWKRDNPAEANAAELKAIEARGE